MSKNLMKIMQKIAFASIIVLALSSVVLADPTRPGGRPGNGGGGGAGNHGGGGSHGGG
ncbi:MAG: hypothetical protein HQK51_15805, partial [Oligoflexia bacterium]|nr:hypothetical protein [Oligoflexia bacterium]